MPSEDDFLEDLYKDLVKHIDLLSQHPMLPATAKELFRSLQHLIAVLIMKLAELEAKQNG